jgi:hypothetical protein
MKLINIGIGNHGDILKLWVVDETKKETDSKRVVEVRASLIPLLNFVKYKLEDKNWKEIARRKTKWEYPRLEEGEFKDMLMEDNPF